MQITPRGALKALKNLEKQGLVVGKLFGRAIQYKINFNLLTKKNIELLLLEEAEYKYKRWVEEFRKFDEAQIIILFGSILKQDKKHNDLDLIFVVDKNKYASLMKKINEKNTVLVKKIHQVIQTMTDLKDNLINEDLVLLSAIKNGVVLKGQNKFVEVLENVANR